MKLQCRCPACHKAFRVPDRYAGHKVKCPACGQPLEIPAAAAPTVMRAEVEPSAPPARPSASSKMLRAEMVADPAVGENATASSADSLKAAAPPPQPLKPPSAAQSSGAPPAEASPFDFSDKSNKPAPGSVAARLHPRKSKKGSPTIVAAVIGGGCVLAIGGIVALAIVLTQQTDEGQTSAGKTPTSVVLNWPEDEREDASLEIDGKTKTIPSSGEIRYKLKPGKHKLTIRRRGYNQIDTQIQLSKGERFVYEPSWEESSFVLADRRDKTDERGFGASGDNTDFDTGFDSPESGRTSTTDETDLHLVDWLQDFELAKKTAAKKNKYIFLLFYSSDSDPDSERVLREILCRKAFRRIVDREYVLVQIDFPHGFAAKERVQDEARNERLKEEFSVNEYPIVIVTDAEGLPFGVFQPEGSLNNVKTQLVGIRGDCQRRDRTFAEIERAEGDRKIKLATEAVQMLGEFGVSRFYGDQIEQWLRKATPLDKGNEKGLLGPLFEEVWKAQTQRLDWENKDEVKKWSRRILDWEKNHKWKDGDRGARLHLVAAQFLLFRLEDRAEARRHIDAGLAAKPKDRDLLASLKQGQAALEGPIGSGTGYLVTTEGHVLTNRHVVEEANHLNVKIPGVSEPLPAKVLAQGDEDHDMALVKIDLPKTAKIKPLQIFTGEPRRGMKVAAFGYPLSTMVGSTLKLTTGIISATADASSEQMHILDCRINPGNSGGPLCNDRGEVVGMVTAKSYGGGYVDSYGMAIPSATLITFLKKHIPNYRPPATPPAKRSLEWDEIDRLVGSSVFMIMVVD